MVLACQTGELSNKQQILQELRRKSELTGHINWLEAQQGQAQKCFPVFYSKVLLEQLCQ